MIKNIIETFDLTKIYDLKKSSKKVIAVDNVNLKIKEGEIFGLLGPNGAGKTTLIQILTTLLQPTKGYANINGVNIIRKPVQAKNSVALMLESSMLYYRMTAYNNLKFFCQIYNVQNYKKKINKITKEFALDKWLNQYVSSLSSGMKMKLALCRTLLLEREILFLDEPTLGLDVNTISFIIDKIRNCNKTVFLTSHDMAVVEKLCTRIAFINRGKILKVGNKEDIKELEESSEISIKIKILKNREELRKILNGQSFINNINEIKDGFIITIEARTYYKDLCAILANFEVLQINEKENNLEDLFKKLIIE